MNPFKINKSITLNLCALAGWINIVGHIIYAKNYLEILILSKADISAGAAYGWVIVFDWLFSVKVLAVVVALILLELVLRLLIQHKISWAFTDDYKHNTKAKVYFYLGLLGHLFPFILPFIFLIFVPG